MHRTLLLLALPISSCATVHAPYPARGEVGLDSIQAHVDSELARHYVEHYLPGGPRDVQDGRISDLLGPYETEPLTTTTLVQLARETSNDFAALYFAERMTRGDRALKERFLAYSRAESPASPAIDMSRYVVLFVPGLFYKSNPETKGDLVDAERLVRSMGIVTDRVTTEDAASVETNAQLIADHITHRPDDGRQLVLVSASKGGPEVLFALGKLLSAKTSSRVTAWLSIGGVLRGSPVADQHLVPPLSWLVGVVSWWRGFPCDMVASLATERSMSRLEASRIPDHITLIHYVGVPVSGTVTPPVRGPYAQMQSYGPSDGLTLLTDELLPGGHVITDLGLDHRFSDPRIEIKTAALTRTVLDFLALKGAQNQ